MPVGTIIYPARWTRGTIMQQGLQKAGNTKILSLARDQLNRILEDLYVRWEWPFLYKHVNGVTPDTNGVFPLPDDFLKSEDETALQVYSIDGQPTKFLPIKEISIVEMDRINDGLSTTASVPTRWAIDASTRTGVVWPMPTISLGCQLIYKFLPPDFPTTPTADYDADIPMFPYGSYLAKAIEVWALSYDQSGNTAYEDSMLQRMLSEIRAIAIPREAVPLDLPLDPISFAPHTFRPEDWNRW